MAKKKYLYNQQIIKKWRRWKFKNTFLLVLSIALFFWLAGTPFVEDFISRVGSLGYVGAFIVGIFFVSTFTVAPASVILLRLAESLHPVEVAVLAGLGAMVGDYVIFRFMSDRVFHEVIPIVRRLHTTRMKILFKSPYFAWLIPLAGAIIIASPLPDEVGVSMMGLSKIDKWKFFAVAYLLNALGIFVVVYLSKV